MSKKSKKPKRSVKEGLIPIATEKRIDWNAIRAEYIGGGISQRKLAEKHGISVDILLKKANRERWKDDREKAGNKAAIKAQQKTAEAAADNAVIAERLKKRLLLRLERIEEKYPFDATEVRTRKGDSTAIYRLRDLTGAYKDIAGDIHITSGDDDPLVKMLEAWENAFSGQ